jgi:hypothetical protein
MSKATSCVSSESKSFSDLGDTDFREVCEFEFTRRSFPKEVSLFLFAVKALMFI